MSAPGSDAWLSPPEPKGRWPRHQRKQSFTITIERDDALCGEGSSDDTFEYEVEVEFDEGSVCGAEITHRYNSHTTPEPVVPRVAVVLTERERESAEVDYSDELIAREEAAREDAADARADR